MRKLLAIIFIFSLLYSTAAFAGDPYKTFYNNYPESEYIVGIGEAPKSANKRIDQRIAEVLARRDIATQIRVRTTEVSVDMMCSSTAVPNCKDEVVSIIETTADELLQGSRVVDKGVNDDNMVFVIVVMLRDGAAANLDSRIVDQLSVARQNLSKAESGDKDALAVAQKNMMKARAYEIESQILRGLDVESSKALKDLQNQLRKIHSDTM
jgi:hypothetical protein